MSKKSRNEWERTINKYNLSLRGKEKYARLRVDHDTGMQYIEAEKEMATKELTIRVIQKLLKLVSLPDEIYDALKEDKDRIIREREMESFKKHNNKSREEAVEKKQGYVYFLKEYHGNTVKIGYAKNPRERIRTMNFVPSIPVELIYTIRSKNAYRLEQMFHLHFSKKRINHGIATEFFELTEEDMSNIYNRNLPEDMLHLIVEEEYELPPRLRRLKQEKQLEQEKQKNSPL